MITLGDAQDKVQAAVLDQVETKTKESPSDSVTAVFEAIKNASLEPVKKYIESGGDLSIRHPVTKMTLIEQAIFSSSVADKIVELLVLAGAPIPVVAPEGIDLLKDKNLSFHLNFPIPQIVESLFNGCKNNSILGVAYSLLAKNIKKIDINVRSTDKTTLLMEACEAGNLAIAKLLLAHKAEINLKDKNKESALMLAAIAGHINVCDFLIANGAAIDLLNVDKANLLLLAAKSDQPELIKKFLKMGFSVHDKDELGCTAAMNAAEEGKAETLLALLEAGASLDVRNIDDDTVIDILVEKGFVSVLEKVFEFLKSKGFSVKEWVNKKLFNGSPLISNAIYYCENNLHDIIKLFVKEGADINAFDDEGYSPVIYAIKENKIDCVKILHELGANLDIINKDYATPLLFACSNGYKDSVEFLLNCKESKIDINRIVSHYYTPLANAIHTNQIEIICLLLNHGANSALILKKGLRKPLTAFDIALERKNTDSLKFLIADKVMATLQKTSLYESLNKEECNLAKLLGYMSSIHSSINILNKEVVHINSYVNSDLFCLVYTLWRLKANFNLEHDCLEILASNFDGFPKTLKNEEVPKILITPEFMETYLKRMEERSKSPKAAEPVEKTEADLIILECSSIKDQVLDFIESQKKREQNRIISNEIISEVRGLEMHFTSTIRSDVNLETQIQRISKMYDNTLKDISALDTFLREKISGSSQILQSKNPGKRDRSKNFAKDLEMNEGRVKNLGKIYVEIEALKNKALAIKKEFYEKYEKMHVEIQMLCLEDNFSEANLQLDVLKKYLFDYKAAYLNILKEGESIEFIWDAVKSQLGISKGDKSSKSSDSRYESKEQIEADEKEFRLEQTKRKEQEEREAKEDLERRLRYKRQEEQAKEERERKIKLEEEAERKRQKADETVRKMMGLEEDVNEDESTEKLDSIKDTLEKPLVSFTPFRHSKKPKGFTLERATGLSKRLERKEKNENLENEMQILEQCIHACCELQPELEAKIFKERKASNELKDSRESRETKETKELKDSTESRESLEYKKTILKTLRMQRNALLGGLARFMDYIKQLKGDHLFSEAHARKLRNYLFKGKKFLIEIDINTDLKKYLKEYFEFNCELINLINELASCSRSEELRKDKLNFESHVFVNSKLFQMIDKESENLDPTDIPSLPICLKSIELANKELKYYEEMNSIQIQNVENVILTQSAIGYVSAARGSFSIWIRDHYRNEYLKKKDEYDQNIELGNKIRHGEKLPKISF